MTSLSTEVGKALIEPINNILKPPSEEFGAFLAQHVQHLRWKSAVKILALVKEKIGDSGGLKNVPDPKIFMKWIEGCSLENENDSDMHEMWASLLVSSSENSSEQALYIDYMNILKNIDGTIARIIDELYGVRFGNAKDILAPEPFEALLEDRMQDLKIEGILRLILNDNKTGYSNFFTPGIVTEVHKSGRLISSIKFNFREVSEQVPLTEETREQIENQNFYLKHAEYSSYSHLDYLLEKFSLAERDSNTFLSELQLSDGKVTCQTSFLKKTLFGTDFYKAVSYKGDAVK